VQPKSDQIPSGNNREHDAWIDCCFGHKEGRAEGKGSWQTSGVHNTCYGHKLQKVLSPKASRVSGS